MQTASRLFDLFLASHPLMPLYVGVSAMHAMRNTLLACEEMHDAHAALSHIDLPGLPMGMPDGNGGRRQGGRVDDSNNAISLERLLGRAVALMEEMPPEVLLRQKWVGFPHSAAVSFCDLVLSWALRGHL